MKRFGLLLVPILALPSGVSANDSSAEFATGGLRFKKDPDIVMRAEDLSISTTQVRIAYTFLNRAPTDKTIMVAFPMPDILGANSDEETAVPTDDPNNMFAFKVLADGVPVALHLEQKALANGIDQTARLREMHVPLMPTATPTNSALDHLPKAGWKGLVDLGLARIETYGSGGPMEDHLVANWTLRSAFTWTQTFPSRRAIKFEQSYQPSVGGSAQTFIGGANWRDIAKEQDYFGKFCIDADLVRAIARAQAEKKAAYPPFSEARIAYVLKTGANWAGPIHDFHLTIDKGVPTNLVSFCADGVKKTGPTTFDVHKTDFVPRRDLFILILTPIP